MPQIADATWLNGSGARTRRRVFIVTPLRGLLEPSSLARSDRQSEPSFTQPNAALGGVALCRRRVRARHPRVSALHPPRPISFRSPASLSLSFLQVPKKRRAREPQGRALRRWCPRWRRGRPPMWRPRDGSEGCGRQDISGAGIRRRSSSFTSPGARSAAQLIALPEDPTVLLRSPACCSSSPCLWVRKSGRCRAPPPRRSACARATSRTWA